MTSPEPTTSTEADAHVRRIDVDFSTFILIQRAVRETSLENDRYQEALTDLIAAWNDGEVVSR